MLMAFENAGIQPIEAMGQRFDHNYHEAMFELEDPSQPAGTVVQVVENGFTLGERLLRPARVGVSRGGPKPEAPAAQPEQPQPAPKSGATAYENQGGGPGETLNEEL